MLWPRRLARAVLFSPFGNCGFCPPGGTIQRYGYMRGQYSEYSAEAIHATAMREFQAHQTFLWGLCYRMTGSAADADELVQETFVRALERPPRDLQDGWNAWLARVAMNLSIDAVRLRKRREYVGLWLPAPVDTGDEASPGDHEIASLETSTEHRYDLVESLSVAFLLALEQLIPRERAVLMLRDVFDYTVQETAKALDLTQTNVKATHHRAREAMRAYDASRLPPTRERQSRTAERLRGLLECLQNHDVSGVEALLASDAHALSDGGGQYHAARLPVVGRKNVAKLLVGLSAKGGTKLQLGFRMLNGLPALVVDAPPRPGFAPRFTFQIALDESGSIRAVYTVLASRKLLAVPKSA
jgi:RNA polymerase sigma factor (sigma-70 family)